MAKTKKTELENEELENDLPESPEELVQIINGINQMSS